MFTVKYQTFNLSAAQSAEGPFYDRCEQLHGPFVLVSQEMDDGCIVVHCHRTHEEPGMTFGPNKGRDRVAGEAPPPCSTLWVMNESGATVATYRL